MFLRPESRGRNATPTFNRHSLLAYYRLTVLTWLELTCCW